MVAAPFGDGVVVNWYDITARKRASAELLCLQVSHHQHIANAVLDTQQAERRRIAESLHNGLGFDQGQLTLLGLGLRTLRDRTQLLNGELAVTSAPGQGTQVVVRVPYGSTPGWPAAIA